MTPEQCQVVLELATAFRRAEEQELYLLTVEDFRDPGDNTFPHIHKLFVTTFADNERGVNVLHEGQTLRVRTEFLQDVEAYLKNNPDYDE